MVKIRCLVWNTWIQRNEWQTVNNKCKSREEANIWVNKNFVPGEKYSITVDGEVTDFYI